MAFPAEWMQNCDPGQMRRNLDDAYKRIAELEAERAQAAPVLAAAAAWYDSPLCEQVRPARALAVAVRNWRAAREG